MSSFVNAIANIPFLVSLLSTVLVSWFFTERKPRLSVSVHRVTFGRQVSIPIAEALATEPRTPGAECIQEVFDGEQQVFLIRISSLSRSGFRQAKDADALTVSVNGPVAWILSNGGSWFVDTPSAPTEIVTLRLREVALRADTPLLLWLACHHDTPLPNVSAGQDRIEIYTDWRRMLTTENVRSTAVAGALLAISSHLAVFFATGVEYWAVPISFFFAPWVALVAFSIGASSDYFTGEGAMRP